MHDADSGFPASSTARSSTRVFAPGLQFKSFVGSEIVVRTVLQGLRYVEVPVSYAQRVGESRGLPARSIARQVRRGRG